MISVIQLKMIKAWMALIPAIKEIANLIYGGRLDEAIPWVTFHVVTIIITISNNHKSITKLHPYLRTVFH